MDKEGVCFISPSRTSAKKPHRVQYLFILAHPIVGKENVLRMFGNFFISFCFFFLNQIFLFFE